jgi:hypothetical protein
MKPDPPKHVVHVHVLAHPLPPVAPAKGLGWAVYPAQTITRRQFVQSFLCQAELNCRQVQVSRDRETEPVDRIQEPGIGGGSSRGHSLPIGCADEQSSPRALPNRAPKKPELLLPSEMVDPIRIRERHLPPFPGRRMGTLSFL